MVWWAVTDWIMIDNFTKRIDSTSSFARVFTLVISACFLNGTVCVNDTLRSTAYQWVAVISLYTDAFEYFSSLTALGVGSAKDIVTRYWLFIRDWREALLKRISNQTTIATAYGIVIENFAICIVTTRSWTWIDTFLTKTCFVKRTF